MILRNPLAVLAAAFAIVLLGGCAASRPPVTASDLDAQAPIRVRVGQPLVIALPADREAGRAWHLAQTTLEALALDGDPTYTAETGSGANAGAAGSEVWRFVAVRKGRDELRFEYRAEASSDGTSSAPARVLRVVRYEVESR